MLSKYRVKEGARNIIYLVLIWIIVQAIVVLTGAINFKSILPYICFLLLADHTNSMWYSTKKFFNFNKGIIYIKLIAVSICCLIYYNSRVEKIIFTDSLQGCIGAIIVMFIFLVKINECLETLLLKTSKLNLVSAIGALLFSLFAAIGNIEAFEGTLLNYKMTGSFILSVIISLVSWFILYYLCFESFYNIIGNFSKNIIVNESKAARRKISPFIIGGLSFLVFLLCWFPYLLTYYPGVMEYDSWVQMMQVLGQPYSNHHPWLQTIIIKGIYELGFALWQSENRAIALYVCCSMSFLALSLSAAIAFLYKKKIKSTYLILLLFLLALSPINGMYSINMWKDIPFAAIFLLFVITLAHMKENIDKGIANNKEWLFFIPLSFALCFMRGNGLYIFLLMIPFMIYTFRKQMKKAIPAIVIVLILGVLYKGPIFDYYNVQDPDLVESISIPVQQIAAVISYDGKVTEEQQELLEQVISLEDVPQAYLGSPGCSDAIKDLIRITDNQEFIHNNSGLFLKTYINIGWNNKYLYTKAFVNETKGYWYHKLTHPFIWATYIHDNGSGICRESKVPDFFADFMSKYIKSYENHFWKYFGNAFFVYLIFLSLSVAIRNKSKYLLIYLPFIGLWLTLLIATPVAADFRYAYAIFLTTPTLIYLITWEASGDKI